MMDYLMIRCEDLLDLILLGRGIWIWLLAKYMPSFGFDRCASVVRKRRTTVESAGCQLAVPLR